MPKPYARFIFLIFAVFASGCAIQPPSSQELNNAYYGEFPSNYKSIIENYLRPRLKEPESGRFTYFMAPQKGWYQFGKVPYQFGWEFCMYVNGKNSYGGYTGNQIEYVMIRNDSVIISHGVGPSFYKEQGGDWCRMRGFK